MPRVSDYHIEMQRLLFSKRTGANLNHNTASISFLLSNFSPPKKKKNQLNLIFESCVIGLIKHNVFFLLFLFLTTVFAASFQFVQITSLFKSETEYKIYHKSV